MAAFNFLLCSVTSNISQREMDEMRRPLEENAHHCAEAHNLPSPAVDVIDDLDKLGLLSQMQRRFCPIVFMNDEADTDPSTLAYHFENPVTMLPAGRVFVNRASGFHSGPYSVFESAAHEILEALCNPRLNIWIEHPDPSLHVDVPFEIADMCQDTYPIAHNGTTWPAANFVTPEWFDRLYFMDADARAALFKAGRGFDHLRRLHMPGEVGPEGYMITREHKSRAVAHASRHPGTSWKARTSLELNAKRHPWSRSYRLGLRL